MATKAFPAGFTDLVSVTGTTKFLGDNGSSNGLGSALQIAEYLRTLAHTWAQTQTIAGDLQLTGGAVRLGTGGTWDTILARAAAASFRLGDADAAAPVAQTLGVQNVVAGTSNTAGAAFTIAGSRGTGTGAGGPLVFQVAPAGGSAGTAQNALATALTINSNRQIDLFSGGSQSLPVITFGTSNTGFYGGANSFSWTTAGTLKLSFDSGFTFWLRDDAANFTIGAAPDVRLFRDAAAALALRNGANAQAFRTYFSHTSASDYTRLAMKTASGVHTIETESAGASGEANIDLALIPKGTGRVRFGTYSAGALSIVGSIEIKDAGGTLRKLAVVN